MQGLPRYFIITTLILFLCTQRYLLVSFIIIGNYALIVCGITAIKDIVIGIGIEYCKRRIAAFCDAIARAGLRFLFALGPPEVLIETDKFYIKKFFFKHLSFARYEYLCTKC